MNGKITALCNFPDPIRSDRFFLSNQCMTSVLWETAGIGIETSAIFSKMFVTYFMFNAKKGHLNRFAI